MARDIKLEEKIIELYQSGLSMAKVGKEVNRSAATVLNVLKKYNIQTRTKGGINALPEQDIIKEYCEDKKGCQVIADKYNVTFNTIKNVLIKNNIPLRTSAETKNPFFKERAFQTIDCEAAAYFLGFLITDGCVLDPDLKNNHPNPTIALELQESDEYILQKLKDWLQLTGPNFYHRSKQSLKSISKTSSLRWYSKAMAQDLAQYGVVPRKTYNTTLPKIDKSLMPHLIRGLIDGDGCLTITHIEGRPRLVISFCGSEQLVTQVKNFLVQELNVHENKVSQTEEHLWCTSWASKEDVLKIGKYLYEDANYYLIRKKEKYLLALNNYDNTEVN